MHAESNGGHWVLYAVYVPVVLLYQSLGGGGWTFMETSDLESIITILESPCTWDLPVHGGLEGIGLDASGFSIDTENSSNSEHVSVLYTK